MISYCLNFFNKNILKYQELQISYFVRWSILSSLQHGSKESRLVSVARAKIQQLGVCNAYKFITYSLKTCSSKKSLNGHGSFFKADIYLWLFLIKFASFWSGIWFVLHCLPTWWSGTSMRNHWSKYIVDWKASRPVLTSNRWLHLYFFVSRFEEFAASSIKFMTPGTGGVAQEWGGGQWWHL